MGRILSAISWKDKAKEVGGLFFVLSVMFVFISLVTYEPADIRSIHYPPNNPVVNKGGRVGAELAYLLYRNVGIAAFFLLFFAGFWSFQAFFRRTIDEPYFKIIAALIAVLSVATLASIQPIFGMGILASTAPGLGGIYGKALEYLLVENLGVLGTYFAVLLSFSLAVILATDWLIWSGFVSACSFLTRYLEGRRRERRRRELLPARPVESQEEPEERRPARTVPPAISKAPDPIRTEAAAHGPVKRAVPYHQPPVDLFEARVEKLRTIGDREIKERMLIIESKLREFGISARVVNREVGPTVTMYELELASGTKIESIQNHQNDLWAALAVPAVRVIAPLPNKGTVGVEVPNPYPDTVRIREFLSERGLADLRKIPLPLLLGKSNSGDKLVRSLTDMPHLLIGGSTGSGKSVCLKSIITSMLLAMSPQEMKLILIDPKRVELNWFVDIPHLWAPVIDDPIKKAPMVLEWLGREMEDRYKLLERARVRNMESFNRLGAETLAQRLRAAGVPEAEVEATPPFLPYIVLVIDEMASLMQAARKQVELAITQLAQKARAVGIHLVCATQSPRADIITGQIKANMTARVAFRVTSQIESRIILDQVGAERLLGKGDMLLMLPGIYQPVRAQCTYVSDEEVTHLVDFLRSQGKPEYHAKLMEIETSFSTEGTEQDELYAEAVDIVVTEQRGSVSLLQRKLGIGYGRAARLIDIMEKNGVVGLFVSEGTPRQVLITREQWEARRRAAV